MNTAKPVRNPPGIGGAKSTSEQNLLAIQPTFTDKGIMTFRTQKITGAKAQVLIAFAIPRRLLIPLRRPLKQFVAIRSATYEDGAAILDCLRSAFAPYRESYSPEAFSDTVLTPDAFRHRLLEMSVLVATSASDEVVGTIGYKVLEGGEGHLRGMAVRPGWQGTGLSNSLLLTAENELREAGCKIVTLDTTEPLNRAIRFYEKNGFRPTGRIGCFFGMPLIEYSKTI